MARGNAVNKKQENYFKKMFNICKLQVRIKH